jgi:hypothetical protein
VVGGLKPRHKKKPRWLSSRKAEREGGRDIFKVLRLYVGTNNWIM